jgi:STE24 endopeptidase
VSARVFIVLMAIVTLVYRLVLVRLADVQRGKPLPSEVADVYDPDRYATYLAYVSDHKRLALLHRAIDLVVLAAIVFSPAFACFEDVADGNPYLIVLLSYGLFWLIGLVVGLAFSYYDTFYIEERYGLNRMDHGEFVHDAVIGEATSLLLTLGGYLVLTFVCVHLGGWTQGFSVSAVHSLGICCAIAAVLGLLAVAAQLVSYVAFRAHYTFTPLPDGELRTRIEALQEGSRRKVQQIYVYNESAKSTGKNAFLLKLLWHREFGIADNFLDGNSDRELLAVLSHEVGHLKHRKDVFDFIEWAAGVLAFLVVVLLVVNPAPVLSLCDWTCASFGLTTNNYYLLFQILMYLLLPLLFVGKLYGMYHSRRCEYEADREAVRNGYGRELIDTFKRMSSDELVNVNPHPVVEALEYTHPGMYHRIVAIEREMERHGELA